MKKVLNTNEPKGPRSSMGAGMGLSGKVGRKRSSLSSGVDSMKSGASNVRSSVTLGVKAVMQVGRRCRFDVLCIERQHECLLFLQEGKNRRTSAKKIVQSFNPRASIGPTQSAAIVVDGKQR